MNTQFTLEQLKSLKLTGMFKRYQAAIDLPSHEQEDAHSLVALLCQAEIEYRNYYRTERLLKNSRLRYHAVLEEVICSPERGLTREMVLRLSDGMFIEKGENVLICGLTGTGKSFFSCALGRSACLLGHKTLYFSMNKFLEALVQAKLDGSYLKWLKTIANQQVLILDDFGIKPLSGYRVEGLVKDFLPVFPKGPSCFPGSFSQYHSCTYCPVEFVDMQLLRVSRHTS